MVGFRKLGPETSCSCREGGATWQGGAARGAGQALMQGGAALQGGATTQGRAALLSQHSACVLLSRPLEVTFPRAAVSVMSSFRLRVGLHGEVWFSQRIYPHPQHRGAGDSLSIQPPILSSRWSPARECGRGLTGRPCWGTDSPRKDVALVQ